MTSSLLPTPYPSPGDVIDGKYQIEKILGEGGMGCVARAYHMLLRYPVALKFMNPQFMTFPGAVERFINEGIASKKIRSDHVVPVDDVGKLSTGAPYLVMPCLEGRDLADLIARDGEPGLPTTRAVYFVMQILRGLQAAHAAQIIHRDMKPSNCFVVKHDGEPDFVRILDFGISKVVQAGSASLTQTNSALGTPLYMSPEQARSPRDVDSRSDLYSVGVILYELLTGHTPFFSESGEFTEILFKLFTADPPPVKSTRPDLPDELAAAVHTALARDPEKRFTTAHDMAVAIAPFGDARSATVLARMRTFKPEQAVSVAPPADIALPPSMVAFSALDAKPPTDVMVHRPTTDVMKGPPVTELMDRTPARMPSSPSEGHISASPVAPEARARPDEAGAQTQSGPKDRRPHVAGASTDLGASRDTAQAPEEKKRSPLVFGLPIVAILAIAGIGLGVASRSAEKTRGTNATAEPPHTADPVVVTPPATTVTVAPPPSIVVATPPSAASSAAAAKPPPRPTNADRHPPGTATSVLDTQLHQ